MSPAGRPKADNPKENRFSIRIDAETNRRLAEYCIENNISKGEAIRKGIHLILQQKSSS